MLESPFPGMDPYLEDQRLWPGFHGLMAATLLQVLQPGLIARYRAAVGTRQYQGLGDHLEDYIEIKEGDSLVTLLDVVSPANKMSAEGREAYLSQRREATVAGANLVEIDLVLQGQPTLEYSRDGLPDWHYAVTVTRMTRPERYEIYTATLQKRLPRFRLPLAANERDFVLDLQGIFTRSFAQGGYASQIDYRNDPPVPLEDEDPHWVDSMLQATGLRESPERVAVAAYYLWEQEGRPHGRDQEHWQQASEQLRWEREKKA